MKWALEFLAGLEGIAELLDTRGVGEPQRITARRRGSLLPYPHPGGGEIISCCRVSTA